MSGPGTQLIATTFDVEQVVERALEGRIRIPDFQRPLRWQRDDVIKLFDSIVRGYPVGSLLLWRRSASAETLQFGALRIEGPALADALWVVDGQQRIISLVNALHSDGQADERFRISYDLRDNQFVATPRAEESAIIPLPVIFDLRKMLHWFADHPGLIDYAEDANDVARAIRAYKIPAYEMSGDDPSALREIFDRINNTGKHLTRAEVFSGLYPGKEEKGAATLDVVAQNISDDLEFGVIDDSAMLQAILARRAPDVSRQIRNEFDEEAHAFAEFADEDRDTAYEQGEVAIGRAVIFLQNTAGVPHFTLLPYRYLLVALTRLFAHFPELDERNLQLVRRWFWRAALVGPEIFRGGTSGAIQALNRAIRPRDLAGSIQRLLELIPESAARVPDLKRFRSNEAATKLVLCSWWGEEPRSLTDGSPFDIADLFVCIDEARTPLDTVLYIFSRYSVPREMSSWAANRILYPEAVYETGPVESLLVLPPEQRPLSGPAWEVALASHNISPEMAAAVERGDAEAFMAARQEALERQLAAFLRQRCEWEFEDTPSLESLVIDDEDEAEELDDDSS